METHKRRHGWGRKGTEGLVTGEGLDMVSVASHLWSNMCLSYCESSSFLSLLLPRWPGAQVGWAGSPLSRAPHAKDLLK